MKTSYEVIVAGAGPAGSITAALLAGCGRDVLLIDKESFPRDKVCGDALPAGVMDVLVSAGMKPEIEKAFESKLFYPIKEMSLISPQGSKVVIKLQNGQGGFGPSVGRRTYLDLMIQQHALSMGAEFQQLKLLRPLMEKGRVTGIEVKGKDGVRQVDAKVVVGADGAASSVSRFLRGDSRLKDRHRAIALRAYLEGIEISPHQVEFYLHRKILPGYIWIFPVDKMTVNIGLGMRLDYYHKRESKLKLLLKEFLSFPEIRSRLKEGWLLRGMGTWPLNFGSQKGLQYAFDGALLIGDAAGFTSPLTGGGIHRSLLSGQLAAEIINQALFSGDYSRNRLMQYEMLSRKKLLADLRRLYYLQGILLRYPGLIDIMISKSWGNIIFGRAIGGDL